VPGPPRGPNGSQGSPNSGKSPPRSTQQENKKSTIRLPSSRDSRIFTRYRFTADSAHPPESRQPMLLPRSHESTMVASAPSLLGPCMVFVKHEIANGPRPNPANRRAGLANLLGVFRQELLTHRGVMPAKTRRGGRKMVPDRAVSSPEMANTFTKSSAPLPNSASKYSQSRAKGQDKFSFHARFLRWAAHPRRSCRRFDLFLR
jgi:hypothetical protein